jgi:hypothetical protein
VTLSRDKGLCVATCGRFGQEGAGDQRHAAGLAGFGDHGIAGRMYADFLRSKWCQWPIREISPELPPFVLLVRSIDPNRKWQWLRI